MQNLFSKFNRKVLYNLIIITIFILGIILRTQAYTYNVFEDDECRLVIALLEAKTYTALFFPLDAGQSAPPLFTCLSMLLGNLFGYKEVVLKFIPYISSLGAIGFFYLFCKNYFSKKLAVISSLFLFAVNHNYIIYSAVFKQYSTDVFFSILCLYFLPRIDVLQLNKKNLILLSFLLILILLFSLPSAFFVGAFAVVNIIYHFRDKEFYKKLILLFTPFILFTVLYYIFNLAPSKINMEAAFPDYWADGFWKLSIADFIRILTFNFKFYFIPNNLTLFELILFVWGSIICFFDKSSVRKTSLYIIFTILAALFASLLHIYPLAGRVGLYLSPLFILLMILPLEKSVLPKPAFWAALIFLILGFSGYSIKYIQQFSDSTNIFKYAPKTLMLEIKDKFKPDKDIILCNSASVTSYIFYSSKYNFETDRVYIMELGEYDEESVYRYLSSLKKNQNYWLYLIKDYRQKPIFPYIHKWLENKKILYFKQERNSYLIYFEN